MDQPSSEPDTVEGCEEALAKFIESHPNKSVKDYYRRILAKLVRYAGGCSSPWVKESD